MVEFTFWRRGDRQWTNKKTSATNKCYKAKKYVVEAPLGSFHWGGDVWAETWKWEGSPSRRAGKGLSSWGSSDSLRPEWVWHVQGTDRNARWQEHERESGKRWVGKFDRQIMAAIKARFRDFTLSDRGGTEMANICPSGCPEFKAFLILETHKTNGRQGPSSHIEAKTWTRQEKVLFFFPLLWHLEQGQSGAPTWDFQSWRCVSKMKGQLRIIIVAMVESGVHRIRCTRAAESSIWWPMSTGTWLPTSILWKGIGGCILSKPSQELHCATLPLYLQSSSWFSEFYSHFQ